jgi:hypothetical protein
MSFRFRFRHPEISLTSIEVRTIQWFFFESFKVIHCSVIKVQPNPCPVWNLRLRFESQFPSVLPTVLGDSLFTISHSNLFVNNFFNYCRFPSLFSSSTTTLLLYHRFIHLSTTFLFFYRHFSSSLFIKRLFARQ